MRESKSMLRIIALIAFSVFTTCAYSASKTILVLGDSLSAEHGIERGTGWVALLEKKLEAEKINSTIVNASISGETTSGGMTRLPALLNKYHPDIVMIELGANDGLRGLSLSATEGNLYAMITAAKKAKAKVLLIGMRLPPNYGTDYAQRFSSMYGKEAKQTQTTLAPFLLAGIADKPELFQADHLHPIASAQPTILSNVWPYLKPLLIK
ncbi:MAG TPA: arylesterase [Burkholderiaceae bacterium]